LENYKNALSETWTTIDKLTLGARNNIFQKNNVEICKC
jgi:hypothetical protein